MNNGKIAVSVFDAHAKPLIQKVLAACETADVVEIRFDYLLPSELSDAISQLERVEFPSPLIATFRSKEQGGHRELFIDERLSFWKAASGKFWGADVEEDIAPEVRGFQARICSHHEFSPNQGNAGSTYQRLSTNDCDVVKIAETIEDAVDGIELWKTLARAVLDRTPFIPVAMGEAGKWTRILGPAHGAFLTYSALESSLSTAPGQIATKDLVEVFRVGHLNRKTRVYGILASSTSHSMSPYIHNAAFARVGLNSVFVPLQIKDLGNFFRRMVRSVSRETDINFHGFSVTIPFKQAVIEHLDDVDAVAQAVGAVNTVLIEDGKLIGSNTDVHGFIAPLQRHLGDIAGSRVAIVGAGGAARACIYALKKEGADVVVYARNEKEGRALADEFSAPFVCFDASLPAIFDFDVLVNATPLGTSGPRKEETVALADQLFNCRLVYDLVYNPLETRLIREARVAGVSHLSGFEMLIAQGVKQFELWTGQPAPIDVMKEAAISRLVANQAL